MRYLLAILIGRLVRVAVRLVRPGGGSALPGLVLSKIAPGLLAKVLGSFEHGLVIITGSAGKSTTTKMTVAIVRAHGLSVFTNPSTANIEQGFYSSILERANLRAEVAGDIAILEMDEAHAAAIVKRVKPRFATILNVLEDQLDRFEDPAFVRRDLAIVGESATEGVVLNADDQNIIWMLADSVGMNNVSWFGLSENVLSSGRSGLGTAPTYLPKLDRPESQTTAIAVHELDLGVVINDGATKLFSFFRAMPTSLLEIFWIAFSTPVSDCCCNENDDGKGEIENKDGEKRSKSDPLECLVMNCAFTNSHGSVQYDCSHCRLNAKKDGSNPGNLSESEVNP